MHRPSLTWSIYILSLHFSDDWLRCKKKKKNKLEKKVKKKLNRMIRLILIIEYYVLNIFFLYIWQAVEKNKIKLMFFPKSHILFAMEGWPVGPIDWWCAMIEMTMHAMGSPWGQVAPGWFWGPGESQSHRVESILPCLACNLPPLPSETIESSVLCARYHRLLGPINHPLSHWLTFAHWGTSTSCKSGSGHSGYRAKPEPTPTPQIHSTRLNDPTEWCVSCPTSQCLAFLSVRKQGGAWAQGKCVTLTECIPLYTYIPLLLCTIVTHYEWIQLMSASADIFLRVMYRNYGIHT